MEICTFATSSSRCNEQVESVLLTGIISLPNVFQGHFCGRQSSKSELHPMTLTLWQSPPIWEWLELVNMKRSLMIMLPSMAKRRLSRWTWIRKQIFSRGKIEVKKIPEVRGICWATAGFEDEGNIWDGLQVASQSGERPSSWQPEPSWELQTLYEELDLPTN